MKRLTFYGTEAADQQRFHAIYDAMQAGCALNRAGQSKDQIRKEAVICKKLEAISDEGPEGQKERRALKSEGEFFLDLEAKEIEVLEAYFQQVPWQFHVKPVIAQLLDSFTTSPDVDPSGR
jgi:hypothetical protein